MIGDQHSVVPKPRASAPTAHEAMWIVSATKRAKNKTTTTTSATNNQGNKVTDRIDGVRIQVETRIEEYLRRKNMQNYVPVEIGFGHILAPIRDT